MLRPRELFSVRTRHRFDRIYRLLSRSAIPRYFVQSGDRYMRVAFCDAMGRLLKAMSGRSVVAHGICGRSAGHPDGNRGIE